MPAVWQLKPHCSFDITMLLLHNPVSDADSSQLPVFTAGLYLSLATAQQPQIYVLLLFVCAMASFNFF